MPWNYPSAAGLNFAWETQAFVGTGVAQTVTHVPAAGVPKCLIACYIINNSAGLAVSPNLWIANDSGADDVAILNGSFFLGRLSGGNIIAKGTFNLAANYSFVMRYAY
jgi:hypothetical protein